MNRFGRDVVPFLSWTLFIAIVFASYGVLAAKKKWCPYYELRQLHFIVETSLGRPEHLYPIRHTQFGVTAKPDSEVAPGVTLITSYWKEFDWKPGAKIIDRSGNVLHEWEIDIPALWPSSPHQDSIAGTKNTRMNYLHGSILLPNGDLIFNIEYLGLFRVNSCGEPLWKLPYRTHHSLHLNRDGSVWASGMRWIDPGTERAKLYPDLKPPFGESTAVLVSADGEILKEVSLLEAIYNSPMKNIYWKYKAKSGDIDHLNDVEPLESELAPQFPQFEEGDLLVSLKFISLVAVVSQNAELKMYEFSEFNHQHDPDFEPGGIISVFDNNMDMTLAGTQLGGSRIAQYDLRSKTSSNSYPEVLDNQLFYTSTGGKHQLLPNGNRLITEANAGRLLEINEQRDVVWQWVHEPYKEKYVAEVLEGTRYDISAAQIKNWACSK